MHPTDPYCAEWSYPSGHFEPEKTATKRSQKSQRSAFTLIELLVVIAIIAILAAILFPVFAQARAKARQVVCLSNLKQIGLAVKMYQQDYDEIYVPKYNCAVFNTQYPDHCDSPKRLDFGFDLDPPVPEWMPATNAPSGTDYLLRPYVKNDEVRRCPSRHIGVPLTQGGLPVEGRYTINAWDSYHGEGRDETGPQGKSDAAVPQPASTIMVVEHTNAAGECQVGQPGGGPGLSESVGHWEENHSGGSNILWCDGHAKWNRISQFRRAWFTIQED